MWTHTALTRLVGVDYPIVQGPFGGGNSTPALAAAVSGAGAIGSFGGVDLEPDGLRELVRAIAALTSRPFNVNLWVPIQGQDDVVPTRTAIARSQLPLLPLFAELGLPGPTEECQSEQPPAQALFEAQVEALLAARPPIMSFVMGVPDPAIVREAKARGIVTFATATTVDEAVALERAGVDAVVASGSEAGGHRGSFLRPVEQSLVGTIALVPQIASAVTCPVIAAGGIADGRGIAAALALGAAGVQIGTAFLVSSESGAPGAHRAALLSPAARVTRLTRAITGRFARGVDNHLMRLLEADLEGVLPYPAQHRQTIGLRREAGKQDRSDLLALWSGQGAPLAQALPAAEIVGKLVRETDQTLRSSRLQPCAADSPR